jgi:hypothetical protein
MLHTNLGVIMDLQHEQRNHKKSTRKVYEKTLDPTKTYLNKIFISQRCDANPNHRNIFWDLTFEQWSELVQKNCYICGGEPVLREGKLHDTIGRKVPINGLDRIDNKKGYTYTNVKTCCSTCNYMKHKLTTDLFMKHIDKIWRHNFANVHI